MKNNIIIAGVPRAGKSTVSHLLSKKYGYQHISMDSIIAGFEKCFPETGVNTYQGLSSLETLRVISGKMAPFVRAMLDSSEYDEFEPGMVLDMYQLLPEDYDKDYSFYKSDEELREGAECIVEQSIIMRKQCEQLGLKYYETATEREQNIQRFLDEYGFTK